MKPAELVNALRREVVKKDEDGQETVLQASKINRDALLVLSEQLNQLLFLGKIDFKKVEGKELLRRYVIFFFIPGFSIILNIKDDAVFWNLMMIIYRILKNPEQVLSEEETSDLIFRLCNGRITLKPNGKVPFPDSVRTTISERTLKSEKEIGESSAAVFLKRLGCVAKEDYESRIDPMNFFIHKICSRGMEKITDCEYSWLVKMLWPVRAKTAFVDGKEIENDGVKKEIIGSIIIDKEKAKVFYKVTGKKLEITWSNGIKEEFKMDKIRSLDYEAEPKPCHLMFLVELLEKAHGQNEEIWNLLIDDICKQEDGNRELNSFFPIDILSLLELCREENMVCTQKFWIAICKRRIDGHIKSEILDADSLSRLKTPGLIHEIFTESATTTDEIQTEFIDVWKKQTSKTFTNSIACLMSQSNKHIDLYWKILIEVAMTTQREHLGDENWLKFFSFSLKFFVNAMKSKSSEFITFMEILIEKLPADNKKVERIFGEIIQQAQSDRISQETLLRLMEKMLEKNHALPSINAVSLCIQKICGEEQMK